MWMAHVGALEVDAMLIQAWWSRTQKHRVIIYAMPLSSTEQEVPFSFWQEWEKKLEGLGNALAIPRKSTHDNGEHTYILNISIL